MPSGSRATPSRCTHKTARPIIETATVPAMLGTQQVVITPTTTFENNQSKTSADAVTVPAP
jgi:hypothetical protein